MENKTIKVLLIEDNPAHARLIQESVTEISEAFFDFESTDRLSTGLERLAAAEFDIVLLDLGLPDSQGFDTFVRTYAQARGVPIIVLTCLDDEALAAKAVLEGAQDYLIKGEADPKVLVRSIRYAIGRQKALAEHLVKTQQVKHGKTVGFIGAKGGVGTTTLAVNVALALAASDKMVIALELRSYFGTFSLQLGQTPVETLAHLLELEPEHLDERELSTRLVNHPTGLRVLFGPQKVDTYKEIKPEQAEAIIKGLADMADYLIIDLPCHPSAATQTALVHSDFVTLIVEPEPACVASGQLTLELLQSWGVGGELVGVVVVNRTVLSLPMRLTEIRAQLGRNIIGVVPPAADGCKRALEFGKPIVISQPDTVAAVSLTEIADRLVTGKALSTSL